MGGGSARPFLILLVYIGSAFLGGALLAPWLYHAVQVLSGPIPELEPLANYTFRRYVQRAFQLFALIGLWPYALALGVRSARDLGLVGPSGRWRFLGAGFATGVGVMIPATLIILAAGARTVATGLTVDRVAAILVIAVSSAAVVSVLEEFLFRGVLFGALRRACDWRLALAATSAIYAILHFFGAPPTPQPVTWVSGLMILPGMLSGFVQIQDLIPAFLTLTLAGGMLALAYQRTGHLYAAIGLHAAWVLWVRGYGLLTRETPGSLTAFWGGDLMIDGWLAFAVMSLTLLGLLGWLPPGSPQLPNSAENRH